MTTEEKCYTSVSSNSYFKDELTPTVTALHCQYEFHKLSLELQTEHFIRHLMLT